MKPGCGVALLLLAAHMSTFVPLCNSFTATIEQSNPFTGQDNNITVMLDAALEIAEGASLTISGLKYGDIVFNTLSTSTLPLYPIIGSEQVFRGGSWTQSTGILKLEVNSTAAVTSKYGFTFILKNPTTPTKTQPDSDSAQQNYPLNNSPPQLAVNDVNDSLLLIVNMSLPAEAGRFDLFGEKAPLTVVDPVTSVVSAQSTPLACANNSVTLTITMMISCYNGSSITLKGLNSSNPIVSQTGENARLQFLSFDKPTGTAQWGRVTGTAWPRLASGAIRSETMLFDVTNPSIANVAPALTVVGTCLSKDGVAGYSFERAVTSPAGSLLGVANGFRPLAVIVPSFTGAQIVQTSPLSTARQLLFVSLTSNVDLDGYASITISVAGRAATAAISNSLQVFTTKTDYGADCPPLLMRAIKLLRCCCCRSWTRRAWTATRRRLRT
jgi:hypothetical protein